MVNDFLSPLKKSTIFLFVILILLLTNPQLQIYFIRFDGMTKGIDPTHFNFLRCWSYECI